MMMGGPAAKLRDFDPTNQKARIGRLVGIFRKRNLAMQREAKFSRLSFCFNDFGFATRGERDLKEGVWELAGWEEFGSTLTRDSHGRPRTRCC